MTAAGAPRTGEQQLLTIPLWILLWCEDGGCGRRTRGKNRFSVVRKHQDLHAPPKNHGQPVQRDAEPNDPAAADTSGSPASVGRLHQTRRDTAASDAQP